MNFKDNIKKLWLFLKYNVKRLYLFLFSKDNDRKFISISVVLHFIILLIFFLFVFFTWILSLSHSDKSVTISADSLSKKTIVNARLIDVSYINNIKIKKEKTKLNEFKKIEQIKKEDRLKKKLIADKKAKKIKKENNLKKKLVKDKMKKEQELKRKLIEEKTKKANEKKTLDKNNEIRRTQQDFIKKMKSKRKEREKKEKALKRKKKILESLHNSANSSLNIESENLQNLEETQSRISKEKVNEIDKYVILFKQIIESNWNNPYADSNDDFSAEIKVSLDTRGHVSSLVILKSSGNTIYDKQLEIAINKSSPFPVTKNNEVWIKLREITFVF